MSVAVGNYHIPPNLVVERVIAHRKPPDVRIWRLSQTPLDLVVKFQPIDIVGFIL
jgi:hypothetical protein